MPLVIALIFALFASVDWVNAEEYYLFRGLDGLTKSDLQVSERFGYEEHGIALTISNAKVSGRLIRRNGPAVPITGTNPKNGILELTFHGESPISLVFQKSIRNDEVIWQSTSQENSAIFRRNLRRAYTQQQIYLTERSCGASHSSLSVVLHRNADLKKLGEQILSNDTLNNIEARFPDFAASDPYMSDLTAPLSVAVVKMANHGILDMDARDENPIDIETGAEVAAVEALRSIREVAFADLAVGGCGGADRSLLIVNKSDLFNGAIFDERKFIDTMTKGLAAVASAGGRKYRIEKPRVSKLRVHPFTSNLRFKVVVASENSRGVANKWDMFNVNFEPTATIDNTQNDFSIYTYVENFSMANRSKGSIEPPSDGWFKRQEEAYEEEAVIAQAIAAEFVSQKLVSSCEMDFGDLDVYGYKTCMGE